MSDQTFVIVGASLTGAKAAEGMRAEGFDGRLVLIGEESVRPYERPPLSKGYLRGEEGRDKVYVHDEGFYTEHDIELLTGSRVTVVDPETSQVTLDSGDSISYDKLLFATGAEARRLRIDGADLDGIRYLRSVQDSDGLRAAIEAATRVVVVGAGWIGSEVAASARQMGRDVALVEMSAVPLERVLGAEMGAFFADLHAAHGVDMHMGTGVESFVGDDAVEGIRTSDGDLIEGDLVVVGVGVAPRVALAEQAGLDIDNGILVDEHLQSSRPGVFAAGDVANAFHPLYGTHLRVEHWSNARNQGEAAGRSMAGADIIYDRVPYFFSDQYEMGMEYSGFATDWDEVVTRGDPAGGEFIAFWLKDGAVQAGMNVNVWDVAEPIGALARSRRQVDASRLTDPDIPLDEVIEG
ncbi:MAG: NAD(P)/FAD-dependent oxidoreductase [Acidimicrobiia bacterium]